jgi:hypothetical protein
MMTFHRSHARLVKTRGVITNIEASGPLSADVGSLLRKKANHESELWKVTSRGSQADFSPFTRTLPHVDLASSEQVLRPERY